MSLQIISFPTIEWIWKIPKYLKSIYSGYNSNYLKELQKNVSNWIFMNFTCQYESTTKFLPKSFFHIFILHAMPISVASFSFFSWVLFNGKYKFYFCSNMKRKFNETQIYNTGFDLFNLYKILCVQRDASDTLWQRV